jgi:carboxypeptidase D
VNSPSYLSRPINFFDELFANASKNNVGIIIYSGNDDMLVSHFGSEIAIQVSYLRSTFLAVDLLMPTKNTTWSGVQGFNQQPSTPWFNDQGDFAGIVHQERNVTYVLFKGAGHTVPQYRPENV